MRFPPPSVVASWPTPNLTNPSTRSDALLAIELTLLPIALICLLLRLFVRIRIVRRSGWDDWLMVASAVFSLGVTVSVILAVQRYGWRIHVWDLTIDQMIRGRQVSIAGQTLFLFASGLAKTSILVSYLRIAPKKSWFRRVTWASIGLVVSAIFIFLIVLWTQCKPASSYWNLFTNARDCEEEGPPLMGQTVVTVLTDLIVYILPMPTLYRLALPAGERVALMVLFSFGLVVVIAGCMRTYWVHHVVDETYDVTWEGYDLWIWTAVEVNLGVICGCLPVLKPLIYPAGGNRSDSSQSQQSSFVNNLVPKNRSGGGSHELEPDEKLRSSNNNDNTTPGSHTPGSPRSPRGSSNANSDQSDHHRSQHKDVDLERYKSGTGGTWLDTGEDEPDGERELAHETRQEDVNEKNDRYRLSLHGPCQKDKGSEQ